MDHKTVIKEFEADGNKYVYDFELLSIEQMLTAETYFKLNDKMFQVLPGTPDDVKLAGSQFALKHAYAALLCKIDASGNPEDFDPALSNNIAAVKKLKGTQARRDLEACKEDFFMKSGLVTSGSAESLTNIITVIKEMPQGQQELMFDLVLQSVKGLAGNSLEQTSIPPELSEDG